MSHFRIDALQVGDSVGVVRHGSWGDYISHAIGTVTKVTRTGQITVEYKGSLTRFDKHGDELGKRYGGERLMCPKQLTANIEERDRERVKQRRIREVTEFLDSRKHCGNYHINDEQKAELMKLVEAI